MGAEQSSSQGGAGAEGEVHVTSKTCYYELLGVDHQASDNEIKRAYRRRALELHPDRNYGDVENATRQFAEVQSAYEVLSDPQERAWYDSHRDTILRNDDLSQNHFEYNVRVTTAGDIIKLISKLTKSVPFTDGPDGFYGNLGNKFSSLAKEENAACDWEGVEAVPYPDFGVNRDSYEEVVRPFYAVWMGFTTKKTFAWMEEYKYTEAPDRRVRRLMEKENKRVREESIREFNDAVRSLVAFVRKRDPRYIPNNQSEADRQKLLREAAAAQAARARAANLAKQDGNSIPDWMKTQENEELFSEPESSEEEYHECVICSKTFKSEKQYETHEKSKKHIKTVQQLKRQMRKENKLLGLNNAVVDNDNATSGSESGGRGSTKVLYTTSQKSESASGGHASDNSSTSTSVSILEPGQPNESVETQLRRAASDATFNIDSKIQSYSDDEPDDLYAPRYEVEGRLEGLSVRDNAARQHKKELGNGGILDHDQLIPNAATLGSDENGRRPKLGKAKAKRARKAARQGSATPDNSLPKFSCVTCNETFGSKTKLFNHIKEKDHAQPVATIGKSIR